VTKSKTQQAIEWILESPSTRSQVAAAEEFGILQPTISRGLARYARKHGIVTPDGRRTQPCG